MGHGRVCHNGFLQKHVHMPLERVQRFWQFSVIASLLVGVCSWQKMTSVRFSVRFCDKLQFLVRFHFYKINRGFVFSVQIGLHSSVDMEAIFHLRLCGMTLEMTYFHAELVQLIVSRNDSELEVQRYSMKKNTLTVDPIMLQDEL